MRRRWWTASAAALTIGLLATLATTSPAGAVDAGDTCQSSALAYATFEAPLVTPDGTAVLFEGNLQPSPPSADRVYRVGLLGGTPEELGAMYDTVHASWQLSSTTADGGRTTMSFSSTNTGRQVQTIGEGPGPVLSYSIPQQGYLGTSAADLAPDGRHAAFVGHAIDDNGEIWLTSEGGVPEQLTETDLSVLNRSPSIADDGDAVAFVSDGDLTGENAEGQVEAFLWTQADGFTQLTTDGDVSAVALDATGSHVAIRTADDVVVWDAEAGATVLSDVPSDAGTGGSHVGISSGGGRVVFSTTAILTGADDGGAPDVFAWDPATDDLTILSTASPTGPHADVAPTISDDGRTVAYLLRSASSWRVGVSRCSAFADVGVGHPFFTELNRMYDLGFSEGYGGVDGSIRALPTSAATRQAAAAWLHRLAGSPAVEDPEIEATDVGPTHPFGTEIDWLLEQGIAEGYSDGTFRGSRPVSRQAMVAWLHRQAGAPAPTGEAPFSDVPDQFADAISWAYETGLVHGYADGTFGSSRFVSRQALAAILIRWIDHVG